MNRQCIIGAMCRIFLGLILLYAAGMKLSYDQPTPVSGRVGIGAFEDLMIRHDVIPIHLIPYVAKGIVSLEVLLGVALLTHLKPRIVSVASLLLLLSFSIYLVLVYLHNGDPTCGCFGTLSRSSLVTQLMRNGLLMVLAALGCLWASAPCPDHHNTTAVSQLDAA